MIKTHDSGRAMLVFIAMLTTGLALVWSPWALVIVGGVFSAIGVVNFLAIDRAGASADPFADGPTEWAKQINARVEALEQRGSVEAAAAKVARDVHKQAAASGFRSSPGLQGIK